MQPRSALQNVMGITEAPNNQGGLLYKNVNKCHFKLISLYFYLIIGSPSTAFTSDIVYNVNG